MRYLQRLLCIILSCSLSWVAAAQRYTNPVLHMDYSDPDVCRVGGDYYMTASSFNCFPGLPILHSRDLVHWDLVTYALHDYPAVGHGEGVWAPSIRYHNGLFYIFCGDPDRGIFMVWSHYITGPWSQPVWVVEAKGYIDPCPFWDEDGKGYLVHGCAGSRAGLKSVLFCAPLSADGTVAGPSRIIYDGHLTNPTIEGPKMYKRDGWYYIFAPAGGVSTGWQTVLRSRSPEGPYEERVVMTSAPGTINGPHQGAWVSTPMGEDWFLHFQDKGAYGRIVHLQPMSWRPDGWPVIGEDPDGDGVGQPVASWTAPKVRRRRAAAPQVPAAGTLPLAWQFQAPVSPYWYCALPDGGLRLYSVEQTPGRRLWDCPNLVAQKFPAESFTVEAAMEFRPNPQLKERGEKAGFVVTGNSYAALQLEDTPEGIWLQYLTCEDAHKGGEETVVALTPVPSGKLKVRLEVLPGAVCRFFYSLDGRQWQQAGADFTAQPELWIGAKWGFFCNRFCPKNDAGWLDITIIQ